MIAANGQKHCRCDSVISVLGTGDATKTELVCQSKRKTHQNATISL